MAFFDHVAAADRAVQAHLGGVVALWSSPEWGDAEVPGIFDRAYERIDASEAGVDQVAPAFFCRVSDLPRHPDEDGSAIRLTIEADHDGFGLVEARTFQIASRQGDGAGGVRLLLLRADLDEAV